MLGHETSSHRAQYNRNTQPSAVIASAVAKERLGCQRFNSGIEGREAQVLTQVSLGPRWISKWPTAGRRRGLQLAALGLAVDLGVVQLLPDAGVVFLVLTPGA